MKRKSWSWIKIFRADQLFLPLKHGKCIPEMFWGTLLFNYCIRWVLMRCPPLWSMRCVGKLENIINSISHTAKGSRFHLTSISFAGGSVSEKEVFWLLSILTNCHPWSQGQCPSPHRCWRFKTMKWTKMIAHPLHPLFSLSLGPRCSGSRPARRYLAFLGFVP